MSGIVGIVIVSHSADVARGTAEMVRQMVGDEVPLAWCGGNGAGGLGTSVELFGPSGQPPALAAQGDREDAPA